MRFKGSFEKSSINLFFVKFLFISDEHKTWFKTLHTNIHTDVWSVIITDSWTRKNIGVGYPVWYTGYYMVDQRT